jgi:hypothetical protein
MDLQQFERCVDGRHVVHAALEATTRRYADDHGIDVTRTLRGELELRGYPAGELEWVDQAAAAVRKLP